MPLHRLTLRQFEAFVAVADLRSFAAAGEKLGLTGSAVSQLVAELESTVGFRVFERSTRKVALAANAREFFSSAQAVLRQVRLSEAAAEGVRNRSAGLVRIGAPLVLASAVLPAAVRAFNEVRPKVVVRIRDIPVDGLLDSLSSANVDLAIGPEFANSGDLARVPAFTSPWVLWCSPSHPLAARRALRWQDLDDAKFIAAGRDHQRSVEQMCQKARVTGHLQPVELVENLTTALGLASEGLVVTLAPAYIGALASRLGLVMRRIKNPETIRQVCLYRPTARPVAAETDAFATFLTDWLRSWRGAKPEAL
jgi:DNA-binding transcriptional LysR family regulator